MTRAQTVRANPRSYQKQLETTINAEPRSSRIQYQNDLGDLCGSALYVVRAAS